MELALLVYFASVVGKISALMVVISSIIMFLIIGSTLIMIICNYGVKSYSWETEDEVALQKKYKDKFFKCSKYLIPLCLFSAIVGSILPTERTVYLMTAAYAIQTIAQNDRVQKIGSDVLEVVEKKLGEMKGESSNDNSK